MSNMTFLILSGKQTPETTDPSLQLWWLSSCVRRSWLMIKCIRCCKAPLKHLYSTKPYHWQHSWQLKLAEKGLFLNAAPQSRAPDMGFFSVSVYLPEERKNWNYIVQNMPRWASKVKSIFQSISQNLLAALLWLIQWSGLEKSPTCLQVNLLNAA